MTAPTLAWPDLKDMEEALLSVYINRPHPCFIHEVHDRLEWVKDITDHLEQVMGEAAFHRIDFSFQALYGVARLLHREIQAIDALWDELIETQRRQDKNLTP